MVFPPKHLQSRGTRQGVPFVSEQSSDQGEGSCWKTVPHSRVLHVNLGIGVHKVKGPARHGGMSYYFGHDSISLSKEAAV